VDFFCFPATFISFHLGFHINPSKNQMFIVNFYLYQFCSSFYWLLFVCYFYHFFDFFLKIFFPQHFISFNLCIKFYPNYFDFYFFCLFIIFLIYLIFWFVPSLFSFIFYTRFGFYFFYCYLFCFFFLIFLDN
jgi:hypothetical protein